MSENDTVDLIDAVDIAQPRMEIGRRSTAAVFGSSAWQLPVFISTKNRLACIEPDVMTSATLRGHMPQKFTWDGTNTRGDVVPDGNYLLWVEVQVDERRLPAATYPFVKGRMPWTTTMPTSSPPQSALTLTYEPLD